MTNEAIKQKIYQILENAPDLKNILISSDPIEIKRENIRNFLTNMLIATFDDNPKIPPLEWVMTRDAITVFRSILSHRSERIAEFSLLKYLDDLLNKKPIDKNEIPEPGFFAELEHLFKGICGKAGIYPDKIPDFIKHEGRQAAILRSKELSTMAKTAQSFMDIYPCGLNSDAIRRRSLNKQRILRYFDATELEWNRWKWHTKNIIRDVSVLQQLIRLNPDEYKAIKLAKKYKLPFGITPYYLSLIDFKSKHTRDYAIRSQVIPPLQYIEKLKQYRDGREDSMDFMLERDTSPIEGITRRYPSIVILKPVLTCPQICVYCQRNWEIEDVYSTNAVLTKEKLDNAINWIKETPEINEVLITGGDPLILSNEKIERILSKLSRIKHIERIRIGTRTLVTLPQRMTSSLVRTINRFHHPGKREIIFITHFEHPYEITPQSLDAVQKIRSSGMAVYNQLVYTFYNSKKFEACALRHKLSLAGVTPYYTFNTKGKEETDDYRVPLARLLQEQKEEARLMPGTVRTDEIVFNVPKLGKNYIGASQHHDIIAILPDGRRVYEFHPWEKQLSLVGTYIYTDVSIYDYLQRLEQIGEDISNYKTIWYYY